MYMYYDNVILLFAKELDLSPNLKTGYDKKKTKFTVSNNTLSQLVYR